MLGDSIRSMKVGGLPIVIRTMRSRRPAVQRRFVAANACAIPGAPGMLARGMVPDDDFDAIAAAKELDDLLGSSTGKDDSYTATLEREIEELNAALAKKDAELAKANQRADQAYAEIEAADKRL